MSPAPNTNWFSTNPGKAKFVVFIICLAFLEGFVRIAVSFDLLPYQNYPTTTRPTYLGELDPLVGQWRFSNRSFKHFESCFDVTYRSNSIGAQDIERDQESSAERRVVVLGDSFTDGFGVMADDRFSGVLERQSGIEHLNFGMGGSMPLPEWLIYKHKAMAYEHSDVFLFLLPFNDFFDYSAPEPLLSDRYRAYLRPADDGYETFYPVAYEDRYLEERKRSTVIRNIIDNNFYLANVLRWATRETKGSMRGHQMTRIEIESETTYDSFNEVQMDMLLWVFDQLADTAGDRNVYIFTIPFFKDFDFARNKGYDFELIQRLEAFSEEHDNFRVVDLLPGFLRHAEANDLDYMDYVLPCDLHWNELGHEVAADVVRQELAGEVYPESP
jgi:hypothetical protein